MFSALFVIHFFCFTISMWNFISLALDVVLMLKVLKRAVVTLYKIIEADWTSSWSLNQLKDRIHANPLCCVIYNLICIVNLQNIIVFFWPCGHEAGVEVEQSFILGHATTIWPKAVSAKKFLRQNKPALTAVTAVSRSR